MANIAVGKARTKNSAGKSLGAAAPSLETLPGERASVAGQGAQAQAATGLTLAISPDNPQPHAGETVQFSATEINGDGNRRDATDDVFWFSVNTKAVTITDAGLAT